MAFPQGIANNRQIILGGEEANAAMGMPWSMDNPGFVNSPLQKGVSRVTCQGNYRQHIILLKETVSSVRTEGEKTEATV